MLVLSVLTMFYGKGFGSGEGMAAPGGQSGQQMEQGGTPPEMPGGEMQGGQSGGEMQGGQPGGSMQGGQQSGTPPTKPEGETGGQMQGGTPPEMPSGNMQGGQPGGNMQGNQQGGAQQGGQPSSGGANIIDTYRFAIYGINGLIIGIFAAYLIVSRCNKRKFNECFKGAKRTIAYIAICVGISIFTSGTLLGISDSLD